MGSTISGEKEFSDNIANKPINVVVKRDRNGNCAYNTK